MYPPIEPYQSGYLDTGDGHQVYWEWCGTPDGMPAVFLHGGPGAGSSPDSRRLFDPARFRVLLFDQRGAGRSQPHAGLEKNETSHLIGDLERLRDLFGIQRWLLFGGSWGSALALAYAETHPQHVSGLILRGVFTARRSEIDWIYNGGAGRIFPEAFGEFLSILDDEERRQPLQAYYHRLIHQDPGTRRSAAIAWSRWEASIVQLRPSAALLETYCDPDFAAALARIEAHYLVNNCWMEENQLLDEAARIAELPVAIVQGRYDTCTPPVTAWDLHQRLPRSRLQLTLAGHRFDDPENLAALVKATDAFAAHLS